MPTDALLDATATRARDAFLEAEVGYQGGGELVAWRAAVEAVLREPREVLERGQPANGRSQLVYSRINQLTTIQSLRGGIEEELSNRVGGRGAEWAVNVVQSNRQDRFTPEAAREFAQCLLVAAAECERFEEEDRA